MQHGGARHGAGRPRELATIARENDIVQRHLKASAEAGWEVLADRYPELMRTAIGIAIGDDAAKPNVSMLKTLVELMLRVVGSEPDQADSAITKLVGNFIDRLSEARRTDDGSALDSDSAGRPERLDSGHALWAAPNSTIPRVAGGIRLDGDN